MRLPLTLNGECIPVNRFQAMARLGSVYLVDQVSRALDSSLEWQKKNQQTIFGGPSNSNHETIYGGTSNLDRYMAQDDNNDTESSESDDDSDGDNNDGKKKTFLSSSVHGSRRHLKRLANNALEVVSELGPPTLFVSLTCNPEWEEIRFMILQ